MKEYALTKKYPLRYSDFDFKDELKISALLAFAQEAAGDSADELGFGYKDLKPKKLAFIIVNTYCELLRPVRLGSALTVTTWPLPPRHVIFERQYLAEDKEGVCARLSSRWCLIDLENFSLLPPERLGQAHEACPYNPNKIVEAVWKIPKLGDDAREVYRMSVRNGHCDHYMHANNTRYADFFLDCFTADELSCRMVKCFQVAYGKQAKEGNELVLYRCDYGEFSICEARCKNETVAHFKIVFEGETE